MQSENPRKLNPSVLAEQAFKEMDIKKDNKISKEEFLTTCLQSNKVCSMLSFRVLDVVGSDAPPASPTYNWENKKVMHRRVRMSTVQEGFISLQSMCVVF